MSRTRTALTRAVRTYMAVNKVSQRTLAANLDMTASALNARLQGVTRWSDEDIDALHFAGVIDADDWAAMVGYVSPLEVTA